MYEIRIKPNNDKQQRFLADRHKYVGFGGAKGGGKSWGIRAKVKLYAMLFPGIRMMIVRRSYPELYENHIKQLVSELHGFAKYNDQRKELKFPNRSECIFRYCMTAKDLLNFHGIEIDVLFIDEGTQFEEIVFDTLCSCVRGVNDFPKQIHVTCNPGGRGHGWVKRRFIDKNMKEHELAEDYNFIKSLLDDNIALMQADPDYENRLMALPPKMREAYRWGNWDIFEGQFFEEFTDDPRMYDEQRFTHVINPFPLHESWTRYRSYDWGSAKPFSCGWWALSHNGTLYRILELYGCGETPDEGLKWTTDQQFAEIRRIEGEHPYLKGHIINGVADPSIWKRDYNGPSIADTAAKHGVYFSPGDNARIPGWTQMHNRFFFDEDGRAQLYIFNTCKAAIRTLPLLVYSDTIPEDLDSKQEDHVADEMRYMCMLNPINPPIRTAPPPKQYDPLDIQPIEDYKVMRI